MVGGASRCGKTTILRAFEERYRQLSSEPLTTISTDDILNALWQEHEGQQDQYPDLVQQVVDDENAMPEPEWIAFQRDTDYLVNRQHAQSRAVWSMRLGSHVMNHLLRFRDAPLLAEGIALLPDLIAPLAQVATVRAVYIGNESPSHADALIRAAREAASPSENWMHGLSDEQIRAYTWPKEAMSRRIGELAAEYGFPYVDMGRGDFTDNVGHAVDMLMQGL